jgi:hypothetical protein
MPITISEKLKPFDHTPGTMCLLPGSNSAVQIFPSLICLYDLSGIESVIIAKIKVNVEGPVKGFTVQLNLEKGNILVFGEGLNGYFRYKLTSSIGGDGVIIHVEKTVDKNLSFHLESGKIALRQENEKQWILSNTITTKPFEITSCDRLSLGVNKSQDWTLIKRRSCLSEIFPFWLRLGQSILKQEFLPCGGTSSLLKFCESAIKEADVNHVSEPFHTLFLAGFKSLMVPRLEDDQHQGFNLPIVSDTGSPLVLLSQGAMLVRSLFATFDSKTLFILPVLPVEFHSGRLLHFRCENLGLLDLEWSKKTIRRMIFFAESDGEIRLNFQKEIKSFRLKKESTSTTNVVQAGTLFELKKGETYFFDCFQK